jgi:hemolysin III
MRFTRFREPVNALTHLVGALLAVVGLIWLQFLTCGDSARMVISLVYSICSILTFTASAVMHLYTGDKKIIRWLIRLDHAAIYLMIAGSYTPIAYLMLDAPYNLWALAVVWLMAIGGAVYKLLRWERDSLLSTLSYVAMGWAIVFLLPSILPQIELAGVVLFLGGGLMYSMGAVVFATKRPNLNRWWGYHELWHMFVLAGCGLHFWAMAYYIIT